jgi:hypothetical protein
MSAVDHLLPRKGRRSESKNHNGVCCVCVLRCVLLVVLCSSWLFVSATGEDSPMYKQSVDLLNKFKRERFVKANAAARIARLWKTIKTGVAGGGGGKSGGSGDDADQSSSEEAPAERAGAGGGGAGAAGGAVSGVQAGATVGSEPAAVGAAGAERQQQVLPMQQAGAGVVGGAGGAGQMQPMQMQQQIAPQPYMQQPQPMYYPPPPPAPAPAPAAEPPQQVLDFITTMTARVGALEVRTTKKRPLPLLFVCSLASCDSDYVNQKTIMICRAGLHTQTGKY